jgi:hypothetical protein
MLHCLTYSSVPTQLRDLRSEIASLHAPATSVDVLGELNLCEASGCAVMSKRVRHSEICSDHTRKTCGLLSSKTFSEISSAAKSCIVPSSTTLYFLLRPPHSIPYLPPLLLLSLHSWQGLLCPFLGSYCVSAQIPLYLFGFGIFFPFEPLYSTPLGSSVCKIIIISARLLSALLLSLLLLALLYSFHYSFIILSSSNLPCTPRYPLRPTPTSVVAASS